MGAKGKSNTYLFPTTRWAIHLRDSVSCVYCLISLDEILEEDADNFLTIDHVRPRSKEGTHLPQNLITACWDCNHQKASNSMRSFCGERGLSYSAVRSRSARWRRKDVELFRGSAKILLGLTPWSSVHQKIVDHSMIVRRHWKDGSFEMQLWEHERTQQYLWCPACGQRPRSQLDYENSSEIVHATEAEQDYYALSDEDNPF